MEAMNWEPKVTPQKTPQSKVRVPSPPGRRPALGPFNPFSLMPEPYSKGYAPFIEVNSPPSRVPPDTTDGRARESKRQTSDSHPIFRIVTPPVYDAMARCDHLSLGSFDSRAYHYTPLQDLEFRLVRLYPESKTMVRCEILHRSLEDAPAYTAISYAWGDPGDTRKIRLGNALVPVSVSLFGALSALRQKRESIFVWADALCIDQQNSSERARQIQLMPEIYSTADSVAVWLGDEADDSSSAINFLRVLAKDAESPEMAYGLISNFFNRRALISVVSLFERDYWQRLWVVQEIFFARSIMVYCGREKDPWSVYLRSSDALSNQRALLDKIFPCGPEHAGSSPLNQLSYSQVLVYQGPNSLPEVQNSISVDKVSLLKTLRVCRRKLASNPRDKLYGILGILAHEERTEFLADYNLPVKGIYTEIVDYLLKTTERLDVICDAVHYPSHTSSTKSQQQKLSLTYDHTFQRTRDPVRSPIDKLETAISGVRGGATLGLPFSGAGPTFVRSA